MLVGVTDDAKAVKTHFESLSRASKGKTAQGVARDMRWRRQGVSVRVAGAARVWDERRAIQALKSLERDGYLVSVSTAGGTRWKIRR